MCCSQPPMCPVVHADAAMPCSQPVEEEEILLKFILAVQKHNKQIQARQAQVCCAAVPAVSLTLYLPVDATVRFEVNLRAPFLCVQMAAQQKQSMPPMAHPYGGMVHPAHPVMGGYPPIARQVIHNPPPYALKNAGIAKPPLRR